jgi:hypothetical protein
MKPRLFIYVVISITLALAISAGPVAAGAEKIPFEGFRSRIANDRGPEKVVGCNVLRKEQWADWDVFDCHDLVDGLWQNYETKFNRKINECDPADPPDPAGLNAPDFGAGIIHGPFMLTPTLAGGGVWKGIWKIVFTPDQDGGLRIRFDARATGYGGDIEGLKLKIGTDTGGIVNSPFLGYILVPHGL